MLALRFPWAWMSLGGLLVAGVVAGSLVPGPALPVILLSDKLMHAGSYALLMCWFAGMYEKRWYWLIAVLLAVLGFGLDVAQSGVATRRFDLLDVAANTGGILIGLALAWFLLDGWCRRVEKWLLP